MKNIVAVLCVLALAPAMSWAQGTNRVIAPQVPQEIAVPDGHVPFLVAHAVGTQGYFCLSSGTSSVWVPFGPQATLFDEELGQVMTHFLSPNPDQGGALRATWQDSRDTSAIWAELAIPSSDGNYVAPGAIPWLRLTVVGQEPGPNGGHRLTAATYIHRVNTVGGIAPTTPCSEVDRRALVPYEADYYFYRPSGRQ
jgi:Protein of unknown function (DUF3455)